MVKLIRDLTSCYEDVLTIHAEAPEAQKLSDTPTGRLGSVQSGGYAGGRHRRCEGEPASLPSCPSFRRSVEVPKPGGAGCAENAEVIGGSMSTVVDDGEIPAVTPGSPRRHKGSRSATGETAATDSRDGPWLVARMGVRRSFDPRPGVQGHAIRNVGVVATRPQQLDNLLYQRSMRMGDRLKGKVAVVTGVGGRGIGYGCALAFAREGAHCGRMRREARGRRRYREGLIKGEGLSYATYVADLTRPEENDALMAFAADEFGGSGYTVECCRFRRVSRRSPRWTENTGAARWWGSSTWCFWAARRPGLI